MSNRTLCKFFASGACLKGDNCDFSHDWKAPPNNICTYYQKGLCAYGSRCRYEHVRASRLDTAAPSSSRNHNSRIFSNSNPQFLPSRRVSSELSGLPRALAESELSAKAFIPHTVPAWNLDTTKPTVLDNGDVLEPRSVNSYDRPLCSFAAAGDCPRGDNCLHVHGDLCSTCGKHCLHPFRPEEREQHKRTCEKMQKNLEALKYSQQIECSVCLECVLSKPTAAERKFGLLSECNHPFCVSCIRNWRGSSPSSGVDVNSTLRACPICRKLSYFVIPSVIWYSTEEEKQEIVGSYKEKLRSIDCKHFNFGNGNCPFGTSCFYKHTVKPGSYIWKNHRPPPSSLRSRRSNAINMDELSDMFEHMMDQIDRQIDNQIDNEYSSWMDDEYVSYNEDFHDGSLTPLELAFMLSGVEGDSDVSFSDDEDYESS